ncbi:16S rRNA (uracil(1498)-N(3))-methyltransferase [Sessilibacter corallicola]|uniref:Ribosomal RNA small subunit methyltransferase E n=1 Tax=Sessilibacter corallicola TaxID=2904075 RepID=A0ABQ0ADK5_9GAMM
MNLLLLSDEHFLSPTTASISGYQFQHLKQVHKAEIGDTVKVGRINGNIGEGKIIEIHADHALMDLHLSITPPQPIPITLILALPRPKMLKRILQTIATIGVKHVFLINSYRVEKSYWHSPLLHEDKIRENLILGLEQGIDTILPVITTKKRFKPFVEDELPAISENSRVIVGHPKASVPCPQNLTEPVTLIIGPEGGFIPYEIDLLCANGAESFNLGPRILRVEQAIPALVYRLLADQALSIG